MLRPRMTVAAIYLIMLVTLGVIEFYLYYFLFWVLKVLWHWVF
jgi:hypothetical protein